MLAALLIVARSVQIAASILFAGIFTFEVVALGPTGPHVDDDRQELDQRLLRLALCALVAALFSALLWFWLVVASMSGLSLAHAFSGEAWRAVLFQTDFGRVWQLRLGLIVVNICPGYLRPGAKETAQHRDARALATRTSSFSSPSPGSVMRRPPAGNRSVSSVMRFISAPRVDGWADYFLSRFS